MAASRRLLVFGGSGFLGLHVVHEATRAGYDVIAAGRTRRKVGREPGPKWFFECDALRAGDVERAFHQFQPENVVVCSALATIADCESYPVLAATLNVEFPSRIARAARESGAHVVFASTDLVFGGKPPRRERFTEEDEPAPLSEYGRTKVAGERAVLASHDGALVARLPLLFGESYSRGLGASDALLAAVRRNERPALFVDEWRTALDVVDAARSIVQLATRLDHGVRHLPGRERLSRFELGLRVLAAAGFSDDEARAAIRPTTRAEAGLADRPADVSLASIHDRDPTLT